MLALTLAALLAAGPDDASCNRSGDRCSWTTGRGKGGGAWFEFAPSSGAGLGPECACSSVTGAKGEPVVFSRPSSAWCTRDDYSLALCPENAPRVMSGSGGTSQRGVLFEGPATNVLLHNRDLSQAVWVKSLMSCTKSATGVDGVANSASLCTASVDNATVTQTIVLAAAQRNSSLYIKRVSGTGAIFVTRDGTTWMDITSELSSLLYKRVVSVEAVGCAYGGCIVAPEMASSITNPTVGIKIATSGDSVAIDLVQDEVGSFPTSPITTSAAAASRAGDAAYATVSPFAPLVLRYSLLATGYNASYMTGAGGSNSASQFYTAYVTPYSNSLGGYINCYAYSGAGSVGQTSVYVPPLGPSPFRCVLSPGVSMTTSMLGVTYTIATAAAAQTFGSIHLGSQPGLNAAGGVVSGVCLDPSPSACPPLRTHPTAIAWVGDSITFGTSADPSRPPAALRALLKHRTVYNLGINGAPVSTCATLADGAISSGAGTLVLLCGVNSLGAGNGNAVLADLVTILNKAKSAGMKVVPVLLTPWATAATWTAAKQASQDVVNAGLLSWCSANGATCVDTSSLGSGSPASLLPAYDSGDGLHLSPAGGAALASLVASANP